MALNKAGPYLFPSSMERAIWIKMKNYLLKVRKRLDHFLRTVELFGMFATSTTKKVITKCVHHNMLLKTLGIVLTFP